jgi:hypothetical protein
MAVPEAIDMATAKATAKAIEKALITILPIVPAVIKSQLVIIVNC